MSAIPREIIYPCPFSKSYGIPAEQAWKLLKIFFLYRFIIACLLALLFYAYFDNKMSTFESKLYQLSTVAYLGIWLVTVPLLAHKVFSYSSFAQIFIFSDILFITLLMHADGGVQSGIGMLLAISIAAGGLLIGGRCAILFAAMASLAMLAEQIYAYQTGNFETSTLTYSGLLGASFFSIVLLSFMLAKRSEQSERLVKTQNLTIARLEELNRYIIQHLQSGILIINAGQKILFQNQSAMRLLSLAAEPQTLGALPADLQLAYDNWLSDNAQSFAIISKTDKAEIQVRFSRLTISGENLYMLIFEDILLYNRRLQQTKLASLGRMTASIAHEIRNPLAAIVHAAQLLSEAEYLLAPELRLTEIIGNHSNRVNQIIEDILKLSRPQQLQKQKIALDEWLPEYINEQQAVLPQLSTHFELAFKVENQNASIDPGHLKQILNNLCANALRYGQPELGKIMIEVDRLQNSPCIRIIDHGPGIAPENRQHLFEPFFTTSGKGAGLGLYISRQLAELNLAELNYAKVNGRSCFILTLANADNVVFEI